MKMVKTAVGECLRTGIDALRGLGFPFAVADRLTRMLTWSEATGLGGLAHIRANEDRIRAAMGRPYGFSARPAGRATVNILDAAGKSLLEGGVRALDLANADARLTGTGIAVVRDSFGSLFLGELTQTAAERGLGTFILFAGNGALLRDSRDLTETAGNADFTPVLERIAGREAADCVAGLLAPPLAEADLPAVAILGFPLERAEGVRAAFDEACRGLEVANRQLAAWHDAVHQGFGIKEADWAWLHSLVARIRVQTSERSRSHAG